MKHLIIIFLAVLVPQTIFAEDLGIFVSMENRGALLGKNKIPIAEHKKMLDGNATQIVSNIPREPLELDFGNTHYFKAGTSITWGRFDLGAYYTSFSSHQNLKNKFKNTYPLSTCPIAKNLHPWGIFPNALRGGSYYPVDKATGIAEADFEFKHFDIEAGATFEAEKISFRLSVGMRFAEYDQSLNVNRSGVPICTFRDGNGKIIPRRCSDPDKVFDAPISYRYPDRVQMQSQLPQFLLPCPQDNNCHHVMH